MPYRGRHPLSRDPVLGRGSISPVLAGLSDSHMSDVERGRGRLDRRPRRGRRGEVGRSSQSFGRRCDAYAQGLTARSSSRGTGRAPTTEIDLVGADRAPVAQKMTFAGSVKCRACRSRRSRPRATSAPSSWCGDAHTTTMGRRHQADGAGRLIGPDRRGVYLSRVRQPNGAGRARPGSGCCR